MIQIRLTILWLLILLVGVSAVVPDTAQEILAKAEQAAKGQWAEPDLDDLSDDTLLPVQTNPLPDTLDLQAHHGIAFSHVLPSTTPQPIPLRL